MRYIFGVLFISGLFLAAAGGICADGLLVPAHPSAPAFSVKYHNVTVTIKDQVALTKIDQVFINEHSAALEATYLFPVPEDVVITSFSMQVGDKTVETQVLKKEEAVKIYEAIVRQMKDPALLQYAGRNLIKASVFPIPPKGERRIQIEYSQLLKMDSGVCQYYYSLDTEKFSNKPLESAGISIAIETTRPIKAVYSPTHNVSISRESERKAFVSYSEKNTRPDIDFILYFSVSEKDLGMDMLTYKQAGEDGYFIMLLSPSHSAPSDAGRAVVFILDTSGSMNGQKIEQAKNSLVFCLNSLREKDNFNVLVFNNSVAAFKNTLVPAEKKAVQEAAEYVKGLSASGGTNIKMALEEGMRMFAGRGASIKNIVFLTDGLPTVEETDVKKILARADELAKDTNIRIFPFGVGYDVNAYFLDKLADEHRALSEYVLPNEDIEVKISSFFSKIGEPVLYDIRVDFGAAGAYDVYPVHLPDVFRGTQLMVLGRYKNAGEADIAVSGTAGDRKTTYTSRVALPQTKLSEPFIPGLWASRKIGYLLDQVWEHGENKELIDEIVNLSRRHGIMTEYTAFLITEDGRVPAEQLRNITQSNLQNAYRNTSGGWAVNQAANRAGLKNQSTRNDNWQNDSQGRRVQIANARNVNGRTFYNRNGQWVDANYKEGTAVKEVSNFSEEYFELARKMNGLSQVQALGKDVTVEVNGEYYRMK